MTGILVAIGIILFIAVVLVLCYFLIPSLRNRDNKKTTREEAAKEEVESMVRTEPNISQKKDSKAELTNLMAEIAEAGKEKGLQFSDRELLWLAAEKYVFRR